jgi:hypothetical protein
MTTLVLIAKQNNPATRHGGAWVKRKYSSYSFLTSALDGGEWSASRPGRALPRGKDPRYPLYRRLGGPQSRSEHVGEEKIRTMVVQPVIWSLYGALWAPSVESMSPNNVLQKKSAVRNFPSNQLLCYKATSQKSLWPLSSQSQPPKQE